jgi:anaerobic ribonucleoside-triphosphate reductase activating protein
VIPVNIYPAVFPRLNVAEVDVVAGAAGPGRRLVVWLQGCLKRCPGCANLPFLPEREASIVSWEDLAGALASVDGITLSGGEPVLQAEALLPLVGHVRSRGQTVVCYTGYTLEELRAENGVLTGFLDCVDLLIDGEYLREVPRAGVYRPSGNQRLHFLSGRIREDECVGAPETVIRIGGQGVTATGTLPAEISRKLSAALAAAGVSLRPVRGGH